MADISDRKNSLETVQVDGLVVMKIMKHCTESLPDLVTGQLLGLDVGKKLEVTNCFPFPSSSADENDEEGARYQIEMMTRLHDINVDHNQVGWYQSTYLGFLNEPIIFTQFNYQSNFEKSIVLVFDPYRSQQGTVSLRAFRLSKTFMSFFKPSQNITPEIIKEHGLTHADMFDELPVEIHNSALMQSFLTQLEEPEYKPDTSSKLNLGFHTFTEKNLEFLIDGSDEITTDQNKFQFYLRNVARQKAAQQQLEKQKIENERRVAEGFPPLNESDLYHNANKTITAPSRLESLLTANQLSNYCTQVNHFADATFTKLHLLNALQKDDGVDASESA